MDRMRPTIVGDIQSTSEGEISVAANSVMRPSTVCPRWRRAMLLNGIEPSSRRCGFQPVSRPDRICATDPDWISIMIGASAAEMMISTIVEAMSASAPPEPRRVLRLDQREDEAEELWREQDRRSSGRRGAARARSRSAARPETARIPW